MTALATGRRKRAPLIAEKAALEARPERMRFTVAQYYKMAEAGVFPDDLRTELINGEIIMSPPPDPIHCSSADRIEEISQSIVPKSVRIRAEKPVHLSDYSEPVPDICVVKRKDYDRQHPTPRDIYLVIEFSNTTLIDDLTSKRDLYARASIKEYWVVDLHGRQVHVFMKPRAGIYREQRLYLDGDTAECTTLPSLQLKVSEILPRKGRR